MPDSREPDRGKPNSSLSLREVTLSQAVTAKQLAGQPDHGYRLCQGTKVSLFELQILQQNRCLRHGPGPITVRNPYFGFLGN